MLILYFFFFSLHRLLCGQNIDIKRDSAIEFVVGIGL